MYWYLGSPYRMFPGGIDAAYLEACRAAALLVSRGFPVYSPIVYTHPLVRDGLLYPRDHALWSAVDAPMVHCAVGIVVLTIDGWEASEGLTDERARFAAAGKPDIFMVPGEVPEALVDYYSCLQGAPCGNVTTCFHAECLTGGRSVALRGTLPLPATAVAPGGARGHGEPSPGTGGAP